jgi:hypothetical protein
LLVKYKDDVFGEGDTFEEWDDVEEWDSFGACCIPRSGNNEDIEYIKEQLDKKSFETFNSDTKFVQNLFHSYYDVDHLILINDEDFSTRPPKKDLKL